jgi:hypothetical protein
MDILRPDPGFLKELARKQEIQRELNTLLPIVDEFKDLPFMAQIRYKSLINEFWELRSRGV